MVILLWSVIFIVSLALLVKSSDWLLESAEKIGLRAGMSPFIIGVTIVAVGTSLLEFVSSFAAILGGVPEVIAGNAVGSNIANILLVVGAAVVIGRQLQFTKNLIDLDLPMLAIATGLFVMLAWDGKVTFAESVILLLAYGIYLVAAIMFKPENEPENEAAVDRPTITRTDILLLIVGTIGLSLGAKYLIDSVVVLSETLQIGAGVIAITAVAFGTSLPELLVSIKAALRGKPELALGNIFGSNLFNLLVVVGLPGLFATIFIDEQTMSIGLPILIIATILFIISGISKRIHFQEGAIFLLIYITFIAKLFGWF